MTAASRQEAERGAAARVRRRVPGLGLLLALAAAFCPGPPAAASGRGEEVRAADSLVRRTYYEGIPEELAESLSEEAVRHLARLLEDSAEVRHHARVLELLGRRGGSTALHAVVEYHADSPEGEVGSAAYRARLATLHALGRLARTQDEALGRLLTGAPPERPRWSCGHLRDLRLARLLREAWLTGLGLSARPEAEAALRGQREAVRRALAAGPHREARVAHERMLRHAEEALRLHAKLRRARAPGSGSPGGRP